MSSTKSYNRRFPSPRLLRERAAEAWRLAASCSLCPRECGTDRRRFSGRCGGGVKAVIADATLHFGEETCLVGEGGSGAVFFSGCNLGCVFCQNEEISRNAHGQAVSVGELAEIFMDLQRLGAQNLNLVTPTHVLPHILEALAVALEKGFRLPLVYNCGGYESLDALALLDGVVDIYLPDVKFFDAQTAARLCGVSDYPERAKTAVIEMHRQVGPLRLDEKGLAERGLLVRHLLLPENLSGCGQWMEFLAGELSPDTAVHIMEHYRPCAEAKSMPGLDRTLRPEEGAEARAGARRAGLHRLMEEPSGALLSLMQRLWK